MKFFSTRIIKILNKNIVRGRFLILAVVCAAVAQYNLPPSNITLTLANPLPLPLWKSVLVMDGPLIPFRISFLLFLAAIILTILAFWGKSIKQFPWKKLRFAKEQTGKTEKEQLYGFNFNLGGNQNTVEVNLFGQSQLWRGNLISMGLLVTSLIFSLVTFFLFRTYTKTNLGLAFWMVSLLLLLASASTRYFYESKPEAHHWRDYLWAGFSLIYCLLTFGLLQNGNSLGVVTFLLTIVSLYSWKLIGTRTLQLSSSSTTSSGVSEEKNKSQKLDLPKQSSGLSVPRIKKLGGKNLRQSFQDFLSSISKQKEVIVFILLVLLGGYFRFANIFNLAPGLNNDVAMLGGATTRILQGKLEYTPFSDIGWGFESLFLYYIAFWMKIVGPNYLAARIASASAGVITLIVLYFLADRVAGKRVAWISTALMGASGFHIVMSDLGSRLILQPLFEALSFLLLWLALEKRKYWLFILTGISLGFTIQAYNASVFYPFLFVLFFIYLSIKKRKKEKGFFQRYLPGVVISVLAFFVTAAPLAGYASSNWDIYRGRSNSLLVIYRMQESERAHPGTYWYPLVRNLVVGSLIFNQRGNSNDLFVEESALDFPITILFVLAFAFTLRFWKKPLPFFLLSWFFMGLAAGYVSEPNANRSIGSFIPIYLMCGLFLAGFISFMAKRFKKASVFFSAPVITIVIVVVAVGLTYWNYVGPNYKYRNGYAEQATGIGAYVNQLRNQNIPIYITDAYFVTDTVRLLSYRSGEDYNERPYTRLSMYDVLAKGFPNASDIAVVLGSWSEEEAVKDVLLKLYPQSKLEIIPKINTQWHFEDNVGYGIIIHQDEIHNPSKLQNGLLSQYYRAWDGQGELIQEFTDPFIILPILPDPDMGQFSTIWSGTFNIDNPGEYGFELRSNNRTQLFVDDQPVVAISEFNKDDPERDQLVDGSIQLSQGSHRIKVVYNYEGGNLRLGVLWKIPGADYNWLPLRNFTP